MQRLSYVLVLIFATATVGLAHDLGIEVSLRVDRIDVEVFYDDGSPAAQARIRVINVDQSIVFEGKADPEGRWHCPRPQPGSYLVTANAGDGHRQTVRLIVPETDHSVTQPQGDRRAEFTRTRWRGLMTGLIVIVALAFIYVRLRHFGSAPSRLPSPPRENPSSRSQLKNRLND
jgi:hypothetical protein